MNTSVHQGVNIADLRIGLLGKPGDRGTLRGMMQDIHSQCRTPVRRRVLERVATVIDQPE
jgi:hypothetical protein